ncbi:hypothetical protein M409DRAFT_55525 [Zasmidium cellare ATCC 36951]|uniref:Secreted protein n=1 Tax=Zasmidium cellare ATCC 36951 TaxID=1080233 RepID=A0A6A6CIV4_ZASCE|nr:uncharacterized protein M409DRAFT_55525 [Zasmidium cellare ATCC 36951]KAF2165629.1 hypothetical protein M409DRAFT_55525 [Zasmidium cellare ATCC 36951]
MEMGVLWCLGLDCRLASSILWAPSSVPADMQLRWTISFGSCSSICLTNNEYPMYDLFVSSSPPSTPLTTRSSGQKRPANDSRMRLDTWLSWHRWRAEWRERTPSKATHGSANSIRCFHLTHINSERIKDLRGLCECGGTNTPARGWRSHLGVPLAIGSVSLRSKSPTTSGILDEYARFTKTGRNDEEHRRPAILDESRPATSSSVCCAIQKI